MFIRLIVSTLFLYSSLGFPVNDILNEPPRNEYLADSPWPMTHRNPYCQASSPLPGPAVNDVDSHRFKAHLASGEAVPITLNISPKNPEGKFSIWAGARNILSKISGQGANWFEAAKIRKPGAVRRAISGAYTILDRDGNYFVPRGRSVLVYREDLSGVPDSNIENVYALELPRPLLIADDEIIVGINMTYDGRVVVVTSESLVAVFERSGGLMSHFRLASDEHVSNSLAVDEDGGIYVVTHKKIYRVNWSHQSLALGWTAEYPSTSEPLPGRLGLGSGTTPTLMGTGSQDKLVVIADGSQVMNIMAFWRDNIPDDWKPMSGMSSRAAGIAPITFGKLNIKRSITEQSMLVRGYDAVVVNNDYGNISADERSNFWTILFSNLKKYAPYGIEKFTWNAEERKLTSVWANSELSVPNGIPAMSSATGLIYYLGQKNEAWTIEGVDWESGRLRFRHVLNDAVRFNSFFAGMEIGYDANLLTGVVGGALKFSRDK